MTYHAYIENDGVQTVLKGPYGTIGQAKVTQAVNSIAAFSFTIHPGHPAYARLFSFTTAVKVVNALDGSVVFDGRVLDVAPAMASSGSLCSEVSCESVEGYLNDTLQPYLAEKQWKGDKSRTGLQEYVDAVLANHNAKAEPFKRIARGIVDARTHETSNSVYKGLKRESTYDAIKKKLVDVFGGEMRIRRDGDGMLRLDYRNSLGTTRDMPIELGVNMRSASRNLSFGDVVTRLTPLGKKLDGSDDRLTIASVNGGKDYIDDAELVKVYGIIEGSVVWDDVEKAANLLTKARAYLEQKRSIPEAVKISALDLSLIGLERESVNLYDRYPCRNSLIGLDATLEVVKVVVDLNSPSKTTYEFGTRSVSQTQQILQAKRKAQQADSRSASVSPISAEWMQQNLKSYRKAARDGA